MWFFLPVCAVRNKYFLSDYDDDDDDDYDDEDDDYDDEDNKNIAIGIWTLIKGWTI